MELGAFSISLAVKDNDVIVAGGDASHNWLILRYSTHAIGLLQGMFEDNTLTFNPGWDSNAMPKSNLCRSPRLAP
jgi:lactoylglutathione lyase